MRVEGMSDLRRRVLEHATAPRAEHQTLHAFVRGPRKNLGAPPLECWGYLTTAFGKSRAMTPAFGAGDVTSPVNWQGRPLTSHEVVVELIGATTKRGGLAVHAEADPRAYPRGRKVTDAQMAAVVRS